MVRVKSRLHSALSKDRPLSPGDVVHSHVRPKVSYQVDGISDRFLVVGIEEPQQTYKICHHRLLRATWIIPASHQQITRCATTQKHGVR